MRPGLREYLVLYRRIVQCRIQTWLRHREIVRAFEPKPWIVVARLYAVPILVLAGAAVLAGSAVRIVSGVGTVKDRPARIRETASAQSTNKASRARQAPDPFPAVDSLVRQELPTPLSVADDVRIALVANKATRQLCAYQCRPGAWKELSKYPVAVGRVPGRKEMSGDRRSPEGIYYIIGRRIWRPVSPTYGPLSYMLDYPNGEDRRQGYTGEGIWIHATGDSPERTSTRGCLGMSTPDLINLARLLGIGIGTPVVVVDDPELQRPDLLLDYDTLRTRQETIMARYRQRRREFAGVLGAWERAWESKDIDRYSNFYDIAGFYGQGMRWGAWRRSKQKTFRNYSFIHVELSDIVVAEYTDTTAVVELLQKYRSDALASEDRKELVFVKNEGQWKIFREETFPKENVL